MKFQQYTSPVMAKSVEDTAFYRYVRLISLNEVGGDPRRFGTTPAQFHADNAERAAKYPHAMLATATHDHKRGEDTRTRIDALSELPDLWDRAIRRWNRGNARRRVDVDGAPAPTENDEYLLYQVLVGTWPTAWLGGGAIDPQELAAYVERIRDYLQKAMREAKFRSSWTNPNLAYEAATRDFASAILSDGDSAFLREFRELTRQCATIGAVSSLAQTTLKLMSPGVPDIYQGCELWDLSLVDPDNRRPVDYALRNAAIESFRTRCANGEQAALLRELVAGWHDGRIKTYVTWQLLHLRRERRDTFLGGEYTPLTVSGARAQHVIAFSRGDVIVVVPRLVRRLLERADGPPVVRFDEERLTLPPSAAARYVDRFTGKTYDVRGDRGAKQLAVGDLLGDFPVAVLTPA